jgi:hypothetical protein
MALPTILAKLARLFKDLREDEKRELLRELQQYRSNLDRAIRRLDRTLRRLARKQKTSKRKTPRRKTRG